MASASTNIGHDLGLGVDAKFWPLLRPLPPPYGLSQVVRILPFSGHDACKWPQR